MNLVTKNPKKSLIDTIIQNSVSNDYEQAVKEWSCLYEYQESNNCICGQHIFNCYVIQNKTTKLFLTVGSTCLLQFMESINNNTEETLLQFRNRNIINSWEYSFLLNIRGFKKISFKQKTILTKLNMVIFHHLKYRPSK